MFKKILLATASTIIISNSINAHAGSLYLGPTILVQDVMTKTNAYRGFSPKMTVGYGELGDEASFAVEAFLIPASASQTDTHLPGAESAKLSRAIGASILPGMVVGAQTVTYARIGFITTKFTGPNIYKTGGQLGVGVSTSVSPNWDLRGEYDYSVYGSVGKMGSPKVDEYSIGFMYRFDDQE